MSINHAILGILSCQPLTGYDLKKIFQESSFMYWSGNNNQIYKALLELQGDGLVTNEVLYQENSPSKKVYTITPDGLSELKEWVLSAPELPDIKNRFLIQLAWADNLNSDELSSLLSRYEQELRSQIMLLQEKERRGSFAPDRTSRETFLWHMIHNNVISSLENELNWLDRVRTGLFTEAKEAREVSYQVIQISDRKIIVCSKAESLSTERGVLDLIAACLENDTNLLLIHSGVLSSEFFQLKTGFAGMALQKFTNYRLRVAAIVPREFALRGRFKELLNECNRGNSFRVFEDVSSAEKWLLGGDGGYETK